MYNTTFTTKTPSAEILINVKAVLISSDKLAEFENKHICNPSCHNYNQKWSCPPHNLTIAQYTRGYPHALVVLFYCPLDQFNYIKSTAMKKRTANTVLKARLNKYMRLLEKEHAGRLIANNSCQLCKPCTRKNNALPHCKKPQKMRYSLDSLGLDATEMCLALFNHQMAHHKQKVSLPHTSAVAVLLLKQLLNEWEIMPLDY